MKDQYKEARRLVNSEALFNQTDLVESLIREEYITWWEIMRDGQQVTPEVFEWWLVTEFLADLLADQGEVIVNKHNSLWWGRTTMGAPLYQDKVIERIANSLYEEPDVDPTRTGARG